MSKLEMNDMQEDSTSLSKLNANQKGNEVGDFIPEDVVDGVVDAAKKTAEMGWKITKGIMKITGL